MGGKLLARADGQVPRDNIALLLVRTRAVPERSVASWELPAEPCSVAEARNAVAA